MVLVVAETLSEVLVRLPDISFGAVEKERFQFLLVK